MPQKPPSYRPFPKRPPPSEVNRPTAAQRGYGSRWQKAREPFLNAHPLCVLCQAEGRTTEATVVDHKIPHKGDWSLFWDESNWQPLCKTCHDKKTATEDGGFGHELSEGSPTA